jgi:hypothetical protein
MLGAGVLEVSVRKKLVTSGAIAKHIEDGEWLDLEKIAGVEITSEDPAFPIEGALAEDGTTGWRAAATGPQVVRVLFDAPQAIRRIQVHFVDKVSERAQEFAVYAGSPEELREVVRQQWNFSPHGNTEEIEDYTVDLQGVAVLEVRIDPDRSHDPRQSQHHASLQRLRLA